jgi:hypothetical protein
MSTKIKKRILDLILYWQHQNRVKLLQKAIDLGHLKDCGLEVQNFEDTHYSKTLI